MSELSSSARFIVLWDTPENPTEFNRHYREVHIPLAKQIPGLRRYTLSRNVSPIRGGDPFYLIAELDFDDMASLEKAFRSPEGQATAEDVATLAAGAQVHSMIYELEEAYRG